MAVWPQCCGGCCSLMPQLWWCLCAFRLVFKVVSFSGMVLLCACRFSKESKHPGGGWTSLVVKIATWVRFMLSVYLWLREVHRVSPWDREENSVIGSLMVGCQDSSPP